MTTVQLQHNHTSVIWVLGRQTFRWVWSRFVRCKPMFILCVSHLFTVLPDNLLHNFFQWVHLFCVILQPDPWTSNDYWYGTWQADNTLDLWGHVCLLCQWVNPTLACQLSGYGCILRVHKSSTTTAEEHFSHCLSVPTLRTSWLLLV